MKNLLIFENNLILYNFIIFIFFHILPYDRFLLIYISFIIFDILEENGAKYEQAVVS
jgi:hypothetical protein